MSQPSAPSRSSRGLGRIAVYYALFGLVTFLLVRYVPMFGDTVSGSDAQPLGLDSLFGPQPGQGVPISGTSWGRALVGGISMLGALAIMIPVTWIYMVTRRHRGYHESVVHTLLILPPAVTGIVMIVNYNIALAFSLAGIVAAVRFRTTLEDTKDAVYVFLSIGVGIASGVQALGLAIILSLVFNGIVLVLWKTQFGNIYADQNTRSGPLSLGDVLAGPASAASALQVGDPAILDAAAPSDLAEIAERAVRLERHLAEERTKKKEKRANTLLLVHTTTAEAAQTYVEQVLEERASQFTLMEVVPVEGRGFALEYLARLDGSGAQGAVIDLLQNSPNGVVTAAELRSLKVKRQA